MKRLKQIEESKKMISDALLKLLEFEALEDITISQIASEAGIGRNTFYNHFQKKDDILTYIMNKLLGEAKQTFRQNENLSLHDLLLWRFTLIRNNPELRVFQKEKDIIIMLKQFRITHSSHFNLQLPVDEYTRSFIWGGIESITMRWLMNGMKESPEEMADKIKGLIE